MAMVLLAIAARAQHGYNPGRKFPKEALQKDFDLLTATLTRHHPSLYAYASPEAFGKACSLQRGRIGDSMTEQQFAYRIIAPLVSMIRCGHTSLAFSRRFTAYSIARRPPSFPLQLRCFSDTMIVLRNLDPGNPAIRQGTQITSIDGLPAAEVIHRIFSHLPLDGFAETNLYDRISLSFPYHHRNVFGIHERYEIGYIDSLGRESKTMMNLYKPEEKTAASTAVGRAGVIGGRSTPRPRILFDSSLKTAFLNLPSFAAGNRLRGFYRRAFSEIGKRQIRSIVIDLRSNGGGEIGNHIRLARYLKDSPFRIADTAVAVSRKLGPKASLFSGRIPNSFVLLFLTKRGQDGGYHLRYWEKKVFRNRNRNAFKGDVYILTAGSTFSAATLFCKTMKGQANVTLVGEETGGGQYASNGLLIPRVTLPSTGLRVSLPLFRLIADRDSRNDGRGVMPDVVVEPNSFGVRAGIDRKLERVRALIKDRLRLDP